MVARTLCAIAMPALESPVALSCLLNGIVLTGYPLTIGAAYWLFVSTVPGSVVAEYGIGTWQHP